MSSWFFPAPPRPTAAVMLFCLPFAGGGATMYRRWAEGLPPAIEVVPIQPPGRENRMNETPHDRLAPLVAELATAIAPRLDRPYAIFGHSLGALVAFELARRLVRDGAPAPAHLFVSAFRSPERESAFAPMHALSDADFVAALRDLGGTPEQVLDHAGLMAIFLPLLRADLAVVETHVHQDGPPLPCPITALTGTTDPRATEAAMAGWRHHTAAGFTQRLVPGGHFFLEDGREAVWGAIADALAVGPMR
ncbi:MAG: thioesterase II family protein [Candidatus Sericytochromatia bacterium]